MIAHPNRSRRAKVIAPAAIAYDHDRDYPALLGTVRSTFAAGQSRGPLFCTDASGLYDLYLDNLAGERQVHTCTACRRFVDSFGGLAFLSDAGETVPAMWDVEDAPFFYNDALAALRSRVGKARVTGPFLSAQATLGTPQTGEWSHFAVSGCATFRHALLTPGQAAAAKREDFKTVSVALAEFTAPMLDEALNLLRAGHLHRSERFTSPVEWLRTLQDRPKGRAGENMLWRAISLAPDGYCHPRASVVGSLLEDIAAGMDFASIKARFDAKVAPLAYQRPQAAPSAGNIAAAEAMVAKLGIAPSLVRRFARLEDCETSWLPMAAADTVPAGVFGHIAAKRASAVLPMVATPPVTVTWDKFARTALLSAEAMQVLVPQHGPFMALTTANDPDAPPILKWDRDEERNTVAWYVYPGGSPAQQWGLSPGSWADASAVVPLPTLWGKSPSPFLGEGVVLVLKGCADSRGGSGNALFPEYLRGEMLAIRSTIEAYSRSAEILGRAEATACGYDVRKAGAGCTVRVLASGRWSAYKIDRWD